MILAHQDSLVRPVAAEVRLSVYRRELQRKLAVLLALALGIGAACMPTWSSAPPASPCRTRFGPLTRAAVVGFLRTQRHALAELSDDALANVIRAVESNNRLVRGHEHRPFNGPMLYFRAALDHQGDGLDPGQWQPYVTESIVVHDVASLHAHLTGADAVAQVAPLLSAYLSA